MFLTDDFEGDNNLALKEAQSEHYQDQLNVIFKAARAQIELATQILGADLYLMGIRI